MVKSLEANVIKRKMGRCRRYTYTALQLFNIPPSLSTFCIRGIMRAWCEMHGSCMLGRVAALYHGNLTFLWKCYLFSKVYPRIDKYLRQDGRQITWMILQISWILYPSPRFILEGFRNTQYYFASVQRPSLAFGDGWCILRVVADWGQAFWTTYGRLMREISGLRM